MIHALQHFGGPFVWDAGPSAGWLEALNDGTRWVINHFIAGKFFIIFSFLFGLSFFIQMDRAAQKGVDFRGRFLWRLFLLFTIGLFHSAIFSLDILIIYAVLGVPLVLLYRLPTKLLIGTAVFLFMGGVQLSTIGYKAVFKPTQSEVVQAAPQTREIPRQISRDGTLSENVENNLTTRLIGKFNFQFGSFGRGYITLGFFILGLLAGRIGLFSNLGRYKKQLYRGSAAAFIMLLALYVWQPHLPRGAMGSISGWLSIQVGNTINLLTAYLWVVLVVGLYQYRSIEKRLVPLVSYGRMGLTNYILQSVIGVFLFYGFGFGLYGLGPFFSVTICLSYTVVQILASHYGSRKFRYGPIEWLWRSGTYLKWQPLRKTTPQ